MLDPTTLKQLHLAVEAVLWPKHWPGMNGGRRFDDHVAEVTQAVLNTLPNGTIKLNDEWMQAQYDTRPRNLRSNE